MMADDYAGLMDALGIEKARIVGVSMGSIIAQKLCLRHPEKVQSAVLMCPWAKVDRYAASVFDHMAVCKAHLDNEQFMEWIQLLIFTKPFWDNDEAYEGLVSGRKDFDTNPVNHCMAFEGRLLLASITMSLRISGRSPRRVLSWVEKTTFLLPPGWGSKSLPAVPNCDSHFYDGAGHAFHWEVLADFNPRVFEWLKSH